MNGKVLTLFLAIFGLLLTALLTRSGELAWMCLPFLAYLGMGILQSVPAERVRLAAERNVEKNNQGDLLTIEISIHIRNQGAAIPRLRLLDPLQPGMRLTSGSLRRVISLASGEETSFTYSFAARRGSFSWKTIQVVTSDSSGLFETRIEVPAPAHIEVHSGLQRFRPLPLHPQRTLHSAGAIPARLGGNGTDFWGVREYHPGDPLRRLDWRLTARHPRKFFTKEFEQEEIADVGLIVDARRKTDVRVGDENLFEHSVRAAASLAEVFLRQGNRVSLLVYGKKPVRVYPGYGKVQLNRILRTLARAQPDAEGSLSGLESLPVQMFSSHSTILIISPLASNDWLLFPRLRGLGYQVLLISPNPIDYARQVLASDRTTLLAIRLAEMERRLEIRKITQLWVPVIDWQVAQPLSPLVREKLNHLRIQQGR